ncbi:MAG TPA: hypothetical protein PLX89_02330 [Verrucomicrobiota bacterium]|nr:hypothetical protein [Verrucomicrobiales bacterium]HRI11815.1 hypothetical protein [Verrucomicrobiota bacterium]
MKPLTSLRPLKRFLLISFVVDSLAGSFNARAADGGYDPEFNPPAELRNTHHWLAVIGRQLYLGDNVSSVLRLHEDGRPDDAWRLKSPLDQAAWALERTPHGGWVVADAFKGSFLEHPDGAYFALRSSVPTVPRPVFFPQEDGSVVINGVMKVAPDGSTLGDFAQRRVLVGANFEDPPRYLIGGSAIPHAVQDHQGRFIVVGNFRKAGDVERLGLVRFLANGSPDRTWNPAPELGITLSPTNSLNILPYQVSLGLDNSVWVGLWVANPEGTETLRLARVSEDGSISANFPNYALSGDGPPISQPDGRILVGGRFDRWSATPATGLVRLMPDGAVDPSFQVTLTGSPAFIASMAADEAGRLWFSGGFSEVNGVACRNLARVFAWTPTAAAPELVAAPSPVRIATNEVLYLGAKLAGFPQPELQWYHNDEPIPGATNRGLRLPIDAGTSLGTIRLVASNPSGTRELEFPAVALAVRSPRPGLFDPGFNRPLTNFAGVTQLVPLAEGGLLVGAGRWDPLEEAGPRVGRLLPGGILDPTFGDQGVVLGKGMVEGLVPLGDGGILVFGELTELARQPVMGIGQLDRNGHLVTRAFPELDVPHVSAVLPLSNGGLVIAGRFTRVGQLPAYRLARLDANLVPDASFTSPLERWQFVDALAFDAQGRLLIAGDRIYTEVVLTNAPPTGLQRLLSNGSPDPEFQRYSAGVRSLFVEPANTLLVGMPARRLTENGEVLVEFLPSGIAGSNPFRGPAFQPDHRMVRMWDGGIVFPVDPLSGPIQKQLIRWTADGLRDFNFVSVFGSAPSGLSPQAVTLLSDGTVVVSVRSLIQANTSEQLEASLRLIRILPDSDLTLSNPRLAESRLEADLATQPGATYKAYRRSRLDSGRGEPANAFEGDGYVRSITVSAEDESGFLEVERR